MAIIPLEGTNIMNTAVQVRDDTHKICLYLEASKKY